MNLQLQSQQNNQYFLAPPYNVYAMFIYSYRNALCTVSLLSSVNSLVWIVLACVYPLLIPFTCMKELTDRLAELSAGKSPVGLHQNINFRMV